MGGKPLESFFFQARIEEYYLVPEYNAIFYIKQEIAVYL